MFSTTKRTIVKIIRFNSIFIFALYLASLYSCNGKNENELIRKQNFDHAWMYHYGDVQDIHNPGLDTGEWTLLDLPHDPSIEMPFMEKEGGAATGQTQGGVFWYRKTFKTPKSEKDKRRLLYFEGIYMESEVWVNGKQVSYHPYGYTSFFCDITELCNPPGNENIVAVKAKNEGKNSRWYAGSGIYRHVWMITTDKLHLDEWGTFITTELLSDGKTKIKITTDLSNQHEKPMESALTVTIKDSCNNTVGIQKTTAHLGSSESQTVNFTLDVAEPVLWSVDNPVLYTAFIEVMSGDQIKDAISIPFGIRTLSFSAEKGFLLNGKSLKLKGGCVHHDNGLLGAAAFDRAEEKKVELMKTNGYNAVRCAHNPPSEKFLEACDRLGILVIDEAFDQWQKQKNPNDYHRFFDDWHEKDLVSMVLRDRNHPSVIAWSIGNEIIERSDSSGVAIAKLLKEIVRRYDSTRPVTAAINDYWDNRNLDWSASPLAFASLDVSGYNYMWKEYENDMKLFPDRVLYGSETTAMERAVNWDLVEKHPAIIGDFIWTAIDYLGESGIGHAIFVKKGEKVPPLFLEWPWFNAWCGDIDICGYNKPQAALRDVLWDNSKIEMLVHTPVPDGYEEKITFWGWPENENSWNWKNREGELMDVTVYTRYPSVAIYLNGKKIEEKVTETKDALTKYSAKFSVKYEPGVLKAVGVSEGIEKESVTLVTTGEAANIRLRADRTEIKNCKDDLTYVQIELIDEEGNVVPDNDTKLSLSISGNGKLLTAGNACPFDMESFRSLTPKTFKGKALAIIQPTGEKGDIVFNVKTTYCEESIQITVK